MLIVRPILFASSHVSADGAQLLGQEGQDFDLVDGHGLLLATVCVFHKTSSIDSRRIDRIDMALAKK